jgi:hypothetical protein
MNREKEPARATLTIVDDNAHLRRVLDRQRIERIKSQCMLVACKCRRQGAAALLSSLSDSPGSRSGRQRYCRGSNGVDELFIASHRRLGTVPMIDPDVFRDSASGGLSPLLVRMGECNEQVGHVDARNLVERSTVVGICL